MRAIFFYLILFLLCAFLPTSLHAQEENKEIKIQGQRYLDLKIKALDKFNSRLEQQQKRLLNKLKRQEKRVGDKLKKTDSAAYARFKNQTLTYDSISKLSKADSSTIAARTAKRRIPL